MHDEKWKLKDKPRYNDYSENLTYKTVRDQENTT
jgi:hypothetical protein